MSSADIEDRTEKLISRREFLHKSLAGGAAVTLSNWACCGKRPMCTVPTRGTASYGTNGAIIAPLLLGERYKRPTSQVYLRVPLGKPPWGRRGVSTLTHTLVIGKMPDSPVATMLYDNVNDPYQLKNIAEAQPDLVRRLVEEELNPWLEKTEDPWLNNP